MTLISALSRLAAACAFLVAGATVLAYVAVINSEPGGLGQSDGQPYGWTALMSVPVLALALAAVVPARMRLLLLGFAGLVLGPLGLIAIFSVGLGFLVALVFAVVGAALAAGTVFGADGGTSRVSRGLHATRH